MLKKILRVLIDSRKLKAASILYLNDLKTLLFLSPSRSRIIFIAGLPKSGSTWLFKMIESVPGFTRRYYTGPVLLDDSGHFLNNWDSISHATFKSHPHFGCSVYKEHTQYTKQNWNILLSNDVKKSVVLIRDLRDVLVSLYYHHINDKNHQFYLKMQNMSFNEGVEFLIQEVLPEYVQWLEGWLEFSKNNKQVLTVKYEDLWDNGDDVLAEILRFYDVRIPKKKLFSIYKNSRIKKPQDLSKSLNGVLSDFSTARKGGHGGWKEKLNDRQIDMFFKTSGVASVMKRCGYV